MDYLYLKVQDGAYAFNLNTNERRALQNHMLKLAAVLRSVEWNDSGDGADDEDKQIRDLLGHGVVLDQAITEARKTVTDLARAIQDAENV